MIKKTLFTTFVLLIAYSLFIYFSPQSPWLKQSIWQENMIRLQEMAYEDIPTKRILIGTSLSLEIRMDSVDSMYNFSAGGGRPTLSMKVLKKMGKIPKELYLETNYLITKNSEKSSYYESLFRPGLYELREYIPALRERNQPMNYVGAFILDCSKKTTALFGGKETDSIKKEKKKKANNKGEINKEEILQKKIALKNRVFSDTIRSADSIRKNTEELQELVDYYKQQGTILYFYEMPVHCQLTSANKPVYTRKILKTFADKNNIVFFPLEDCKKYVTHDGMHLDSESSDRYNKHFEKEILKQKKH